MQKELLCAALFKIIISFKGLVIDELILFVVPAVKLTDLLADLL